MRDLLDCSRLKKNGYFALDQPLAKLTSDKKDPLIGEIRSKLKIPEVHFTFFWTKKGKKKLTEMPNF